MTVRDDAILLPIVTALIAVLAQGCFDLACHAVARTRGSSRRHGMTQLCARNGDRDRASHLQTRGHRRIRWKTAILRGSSHSGEADRPRSIFHRETRYLPSSSLPARFLVALFSGEHNPTRRETSSRCYWLTQTMREIQTTSDRGRRHR